MNDRDALGALRPQPCRSALLALCRDSAAGEIDQG